MAANVSPSKATTTVKQANLTAAAKDDNFFASATGATEDNSVRLAVLANDPGAARLYSVWQASESVISATQVQVSTKASLKSGATVAMNTDGTISYAAGNAFQSLAEGELATDTFTYTVRMANGTLSTASVTVQVLGQNDQASITGGAIGAVTEDASKAAAGQLTVSDVDHDQAGFKAASDLIGVYGKFTFDGGAWTFDADDALDAVQALGAGKTALQTLTVTSIDGTASEIIAVTINGVNDTASISGDKSGNVTEDDTSAAAGSLSVADVDSGENGFQAVSDPSGTYGKFTFDGGTWTFAADNALDAVQALGAGKTAIQTLTVTSIDGTASETIAVTINGVNDVASISGDKSGTVTEDDTSAAAGILSVADVDSGENGFQAISGDALRGIYGDFTFDNGAWTYTLRNDSDNVQALKTNETVFDRLVVKSLDGTASETIQISLYGTNEGVTTAAAVANAKASIPVNFPKSPAQAHSVTAQPTENDVTTHEVMVELVGQPNANAASASSQGKGHFA